jgi:hypothetical protein
MAYTDSGEFYDDDRRRVMVKDRLGLGGDVRLKSGFTYPGTLYFDHKPVSIVAKPFPLEAAQAKFFFRVGSQAFVKDLDNAHVCRLGIVDGDEDLINEIGPEFTSCDPLELDMEAVELWDTAAVDPTDRKVTKKLKRTAAPTMSELRAREG